MYRLINLLFLTCLITVEARFTYPITFNRNNNLSDDAKEKIVYQLPGTVKPNNYAIELTPRFKDNDQSKSFTFDGLIKIDFDLTKDVDKIILHSRNLTLQKKSIKLESENGKIVNIVMKSDTEEDLARDFKIFEPVSPRKNFDKGNYKLSIEYTGILHDDMRGFYKSSYKNEKNETVWLAATHFEPVGARRAFPCFDEPQYKATFDITINLAHLSENNKIKYSAISNTKSRTEDGSPKIVFETTPLMSTYLVAFVVSDFKSVPNVDKTFNVYARPNAIQHAHLASETGEKILKELEKYTGIDFEIKKMDQAAIPDFAAGAMENWGLVLYREKSLLYDEKVFTTSEKQNIVETIAHEFAHQWFGDLVSPKWWKYLWLNEGFATFFQSYITEKVEPKWRSVDQSVVKSIQSTALDFDSGPSTHSINQNVESPKEISAIFDSISYQKGGAVIRMMQHFLTESIFQNGLKQYLTTNKYKAADSDDLFKALQNAAGKTDLNITKIMDTWVNHKGYPIVTVTRDYEKKQVKIVQERFFSYNASKNETEDKHKWHIPLNFATEKDPKFNETIPDRWLVDLNDNIPDLAESNQWLIVNKQQTGFYRVNYDDNNWKLIINALTSGEHNQIHVLNRAQLVNDALAFVKQKKLNLTTLLYLTAYLKNETDYIAWYPGYKTFSWLNSKLINTEHHQIFKEYVINATKTLIESVKLEESTKDEHLTKLNRIAAINLACLVGDKECTNQFKTKLENWLNDSVKNAISPDLKQATLCYGLRTATFEVWEKTLELYENITNSIEKTNLLNALGCSANETILQHYLSYASQDDSPIKDISQVIKSINEHTDVGINITLDFVTTRFPTLLRKIKNENDIVTIITNIGEKITTQVQLEKLIKAKDHDIHTKFTSKAIETAEKNIQWIKENTADLIAWKEGLQKSGVSIIVASVGLMSSLLVVILAITN